jgi:hypothetical protein
MVPAGWPLNPGPNTQLAGVVLGAGDKSCLGCHSAARRQRLPEIVKELIQPTGESYCDDVLLKSLGKTMPPDGDTVPYKKQIDFLKQACIDAAK